MMLLELNNINRTELPFLIKYHLQKSETYAQNGMRLKKTNHYPAKIQYNIKYVINSTYFISKIKVIILQMLHMSICPKTEDCN